MIAVRPAEDRDLPEVLDLTQALFELSHVSSVTELDKDHVLGLLKNEMRSDIGQAFVAVEDDGKVVGVIAGLLYPLWTQPNHMTGTELLYYVLPEYRRTKAGKKLFDALEKWARSRGAQSMVMVSPSNKHELRLGKMYESKGYVPVERNYMRTF
jgi:GNAT superfamily N-acetyltransferase